jgi:CubicO group peptidase (beta-lactamase class C family)
MGSHGGVLAIVESGVLVANRGGDSVVPWWSFTKLVIAAAAPARLVRDKKLALDTLLDGRAFTLRQLLAHQAGVAEYGAIAEYHAALARDEERWPVATLLERAAVDHGRGRYCGRTPAALMTAAHFGISRLI